MATPNRFNDPFRALEDQEEARRRRGELCELLIRPRPDEYRDLIGQLPNLRPNRTIFDLGANSRQQEINSTIFPNPTVNIPFTLREIQDAYNVDPGGLRFITSSLEEKNRQKFSQLYREWELRNLSASHLDLNTKFGYFRKQSKRSIEILLLQAIADGDSFVTKTTEYRPDPGTVSLFDYTIVKLDTKTFRISSVYLPNDISKDEKKVNLFRHRLRQLGIRCVSIKGNNRLFLDKDNYILLKPDVLFEIPYPYKICCLPEKWLDKAVIEIPAQYSLGFDSNDTVELKQFKFNSSPYECKVYITPEPSWLRIKVLAIPDKAHKTYDILSSQQMFSWKDVHSQVNLKHAINKVVKLLETEIRIQIDKKAKEYSDKMKLFNSQSNYAYSQGGGGGTTSRSNITWTTTNSTATTISTNAYYTIDNNLTRR